MRPIGPTAPWHSVMTDVVSDLVRRGGHPER